MLLKFLSTDEGVIMLDSIGAIDKCVVRYVINAMESSAHHSVGDWDINWHDMLFQISSSHSGYSFLLQSPETLRLSQCLLVLSQYNRTSSARPMLDKLFSTITPIMTGLWFGVALRQKDLIGSQARSLLRNFVDSLRNVKEDNYFFHKRLEVLCAMLHNLDTLIIVHTDELLSTDIELLFNDNIDRTSDSNDYGSWKRTCGRSHLISCLYRSTAAIKPSVPRQTHNIHLNDNVATRSCESTWMIAEPGIGVKERSIWTICFLLSNQNSYTALDVVNAFTAVVSGLYDTPYFASSMCDCSITESDPTRHQSDTPDVGRLFCFLQSLFANHDLEDIISKDKSGQCAHFLISDSTTEGQGHICWFSVCVVALFKDAKKAVNAIQEQRKHLDFGDTYRPPANTIFRLVREILELECPQLLLSIDNISREILPYSFHGILMLWLRQSFVGVLSFGDALLLNAVVLLEGWEYQIYFAIALFRHIQDIFFSYTVVASRDDADGMYTTLCDRLLSFRVIENMEFALTLQTRYGANFLRGAGSMISTQASGITR